MVRKACNIRCNGTCCYYQLKKKTRTRTHRAYLSQTMSTFCLKKKKFPFLFWCITLHVAMVRTEMVANLYHASGLLNTHKEQHTFMISDG